MRECAHVDKWGTPCHDFKRISEDENGKTFRCDCGESYKVESMSAYMHRKAAWELFWPQVQQQLKGHTP